MEILKNNPLISIIIPVYNVEEFLGKCLDSVQNQQFKEFEVIIINDGSTDNSEKTIQKFLKNFDKCVYINQKNQGPSAARNAGIEKSSGKYLVFLDSDDFIEPNFLSVLYKEITTSDADIVCCNFNFFYPKTNTKVFVPIGSIPGDYNNLQALKKLILDIGTRFYAWNKIYKRSLFDENKIKFPNMYFEDIATIPKLFYFAKKIKIISAVLYNYTVRETSIVGNASAKKTNDYIKSLGVLRSFLEENNIYEQLKPRFLVHAMIMKLVAYYNVFRIHAFKKSFSGITKNFENAGKSIDFFTNKKFEPDKTEENFEPAKPITEPVKLYKPKLKVKNKNKAQKKVKLKKKPFKKTPL